MRTLAAIRHIDFEDLGYFEAPLRRAGYDIRYVEGQEVALAFANVIEAEMVVVLGGPMGVYEADSYPFLTHELALIRERVAAGRPVLGICLGAQLIAGAMRARVYPGGTKEIGFAPVRLTDAGARSPLGALAGGQPVLHWHGDTFDLPQGAELLASSDLYAHQAFSTGRNVLALQFHLEAGLGIERWLTGHAAELASASIDINALRADADRQAPCLEAAADRILSAWLDQLMA